MTEAKTVVMPLIATARATSPGIGCSECDPDTARAVVGVTRVFESKNKPSFHALRYANLQVEQDELFGLLGPKGAGKTTLIKILSTLLLPTSGTARVAGFDVVHEAERLRLCAKLVLYPLDLDAPVSLPETGVSGTRASGRETPATNLAVTVA